MRLILFFLFSLSQIAFSEEETVERKNEVIPIAHFKAEVYNSILKRRVKVDITLDAYTKNANEAEIGSLDFCYISSINTTCFELDPIGRSQFIEAIAKFNDWRKKAAAKKDSFEKEIASIIIEKSFFIQGKEMHRGQMTDNKVTFHFFTLAPLKYMLAVSFPKIISSKNQFFTREPETIYFDVQAADKLKNNLEPEKLMKEVKKFFKKMDKRDSDYK